MAEVKKGIYDQSSFDAMKSRLKGKNQIILRRPWKIETTHSLRTTRLARDSTEVGFFPALEEQE